jgi:hypothetical protein
MNRVKLSILMLTYVECIKLTRDVVPQCSRLDTRSLQSETMMKTRNTVALVSGTNLVRRAKMQ